MSSTSSIASIARSVASICTFLPRRGGFGGQLNNLIQLIDADKVLQSAIILSTECCLQTIGAGIYHRYIVMQLERAGRKTIWLRLDRRRGSFVTNAQLLRSLGSTRANDTVSPSFSPPEITADDVVQMRFSTSRDALVPTLDARENEQTFTTPPTLHQLKQLLMIVVAKLSTYEIWPVSD